MNARMVWLAVSIAMTFAFSPAVFAAPPEDNRKLELVAQTGHTRNMIGAEWSPDGRHIVTFNADKTAMIWDAGTGEALRVLSGHEKDLKDACYSPDGKKIATAAEDNKVIVWNAASGEKLLTLQTEKSTFNSVRFSPDGKRLVTTAYLPVVWDAVSGEKLLTLETHRAAGAACFSPDGKRLLTGLWNGSAVICDSVTGETIHVLAGHAEKVLIAVFSPDGKTVATAANDGMIFWDATTGKQTQQRKYGRPSFSPDGKRVVNPSPEGSSVTNVATGELVSSFDGSTDSVVSTRFSPDGKRVVTTYDTRLALVWDATTGRLVSTLAGHASMLRSVDFTPHGNRLAVSANDQAALLWDLVKGERTRVLTGHADYVPTVAFSPDGKKLVTASGDKTVVVWDALAGQQLLSLSHAKPLFSACFSPDGKQILSVDWDDKPTIRDARTGETVRSFAGKLAEFSPDGKRVLTALNDGTVVAWNTATGAKDFSVVPANLAEDRGEYNWATSAVFSPDSSRFVTTCYDKITILWDGATGKRAHTLAGHTSCVNRAGFSPDGKRVVTASDDKTCVVWNVATGEQIHTLRGHTGNVTWAIFDADGKRIISASLDGSVRIWNADTGNELAALLAFDAGKDWLVMTPDGYFDSSENGARFVGFRVAGTNDLVPLERYRKQFERPGLLAKVWAGEDYRGARAVSRDLPPKVRIISPAAGGESKDGKLTVEAEAVSQGEYPVKQFRLMVNGRPHTAKLGLFDIADPKPGTATAKWEIELDPGRHTIEVLAHTNAVFAKSEPAEVKYVGGDAGGVDLPTLYILSIGVSKYPAQPLDFAHRDAEEIAKAFQTHSKPLFKKIEAKVLTDEKATKNEVMDGLDWLRRSMTQKDFGVFFFAGHGVKDSRDSVYFLPVDGDREKLARSALDGDVISKELTSTVGQLLVILDACHAGAVGGGKSRGLSDNLLKDLSSEEKGIAIMSSASGREEAGESREHQHGKFTVALLEGLRGKGDGMDAKIGLTDGAVYFKKLDSYVTDRVKALSKGEQHPVTCIPRNFRDFPISKP